MAPGRRLKKGFWPSMRQISGSYVTNRAIRGLTDEKGSEPTALAPNHQALYGDKLPFLRTMPGILRFRSGSVRVWIAYRSPNLPFYISGLAFS
jgi:hypothetical protein